MKPKKSIIIAGSRGIGKAISNSLKTISKKTISLSSKDLDTSNIKQVYSFIKKEKQTDVLVLNTGGPPAINFFESDDNTWSKYINQLFFSFIIILRDLKINKNGFIFLISSFHIKEINQKLPISNSLRSATWSVLKSVTEELSKFNISTINIAPGPFDTDRIRSLNPDLEKVKSKLILKQLGKTSDIGNIVKCIVENDIKSLNGTTLFMDGGNSKSIF